LRETKPPPANQSDESSFLILYRFYVRSVYPHPTELYAPVHVVRKLFHCEKPSNFGVSNFNVFGVPSWIQKSRMNSNPLQTKEI
jgi:hypothetical protein